jgi:hypothetical protein
MPAGLFDKRLLSQTGPLGAGGLGFQTLSVNQLRSEHSIYSVGLCLRMYRNIRAHGTLPDGILIYERAHGDVTYEPAHGDVTNVWPLGDQNAEELPRSFRGGEGLLVTSFRETTVTESQCNSMSARTQHQADTLGDARTISTIRVNIPHYWQSWGYLRQGCELKGSACNFTYPNN